MRKYAVHFFNGGKYMQTSSPGKDDFLTLVISSECGEQSSVNDEYFSLVASASAHGRNLGEVGYI